MKTAARAHVLAVMKACRPPYCTFLSGIAERPPNVLVKHALKTPYLAKKCNTRITHELLITSGACPLHPHCELLSVKHLTTDAHQHRPTTDQQGAVTDQLRPGSDQHRPDSGQHGAESDSHPPDSDQYKLGRSRGRDDTVLNFDDYNNAFRPKSTTELVRALFVLKLCSFDWIVNNALTLVAVSTRILGQTLTDCLLRATAYGHFVAGDCPSDLDKCISKLRVAGVRPMLAVPIEEDIGGTTDSSKYDTCLDIILDIIRMEADVESQWPMVHLKLTSFIPAELCKSMSHNTPSPHKDVTIIDNLADVMEGRKQQVDVDYLDADERLALTEALKRLNQLCQVASMVKTVIWVDAEYTYINPALRLLTLAAMKVYNHKRPVIAYTYQHCLRASLDELLEDIEFTRQNNICFGAKLVRGAYSEKERLLAKKLGYPDPVHANIENTHAMYDKAVSTMLEAIQERPAMTNVTICTHNEQSIIKSTQRMQELGLKNDSGQVYFGQLLGMADHISCSIGQAGYLVFKSLPYGSISDTLPYLGRRAQENRAVLQGAKREQSLMWSALKSRILN